VVSVTVLALVAIGVAAGTAAAEPSSSVVATQPPGSATPTEPPASDSLDPASSLSERERYRASLLSPTFDVLERQPGFQVGGLAPDADEIVVYWKGEFGPEAQAAVDEAKSRGLVVRVIWVPYAFDELRVIAGHLGEALAAKGIEIDGYEIGGPFDQITVWGTALNESAETRRIAEETAAEVLPTDVTLVIITGPGPVTPADSRHNDGGQPTVGNG
jgi:hypothetical protein